MPRTSRSRRFRTARPVALATAAALALGVSIAGAAPAQAADPVSIQLLGINDFHGRIWASPNNQLGATLIGKVNELRATNPNTVFVSSGDNIGASTFESFIADDNPTIDVLNAGGLDVSAVGNHEFDQGVTDLLDRIPAEFGGVEDPTTDLVKTTFPYLGANVYAKGTQDPILPEYAIEERAGVTIGFVGLVTQETSSLVAPPGIATVDFGDPLVALDRVAADLSDGDAGNGEAEVIVALLHDGSESTDCNTIAGEQTNFGNLVRNASASVDVIYSAHTHQTYSCTIGGRPVVQSGSYAANLAQVVLSVDPDNGTVLSAASATIPAAGATPDQAVLDIVNPAVAQADVIGAQPVGSITGDIKRATNASGGEDRGSESSLGSLVADMQLWATSENPDFGGAVDSQIAFMNPGGLRADLLYAPDGVVSYKEAALVQPFANTLVTMDLTGEQIERVLEEQWQPAGASRPVLRLGVSEGFSYTYDPSAAAGAHITSITFNGAPLDPAATYRVTVNSFLATGGDNFTTLREGTNRADSGQVDLQAAVDYFAAVGPVSPPALGRSSEQAIPPVDETTLPDSEADVVTAPAFARAGETLTIPTGLAQGTVVEAWLYSEPVRLFRGGVGADGTIAVTLPADVEPGAHKLVVTNNADALVGWAPITVAGATDSAVNVTPPAIVGDAYRGATVTADPGTWLPGEGVEFSYQWLRDGQPISGATSATYVVQSRDVRHQLSVEVTATVEGLDPVSATSAAVEVAKDAPVTPIVNVEAPSIRGNAAFASIVWADKGEWTGGGSGVWYSYQWNRDGQPIRWGVLPVYIPSRADIGHQLSVTVTAHAKGTDAVSATSEAVTVASKPAGWPWR